MFITQVLQYDCRSKEVLPRNTTNCSKPSQSLEACHCPAVLNRSSTISHELGRKPSEATGGCLWPLSFKTDS